MNKLRCSILKDAFSMQWKIKHWHFHSTNVCSQWISHQSSAKTFPGTLHRLFERICKMEFREQTFLFQIYFCTFDLSRERNLTAADESKISWKKIDDSQNQTKSYIMHILKKKTKLIFTKLIFVYRRKLELIRRNQNTSIFLNKILYISIYEK